MIAKEMRKLTERAKEQRESKQKSEAIIKEIRLLEIAASKKKWWLITGIPQLLDKAKHAAKEGETFYKETIDFCPDYVVETLENMGYDVQRSIKRCGVCHYDHVLVIRW